MIYVAAPYSDPDKAVVEERMKRVCAVMAKMTVEGKFVVSPLLCHFLLDYGKLARDWVYWQHYSREMMLRCDSVTVIMLPGWKESVGVTGELKLAEELGKPVTFVAVD